MQLSSKITFSISSFIIGLTIISILFPALLIRISSPNQLSPVEPLELGYLAIPLFTGNLIIFLIIFLFKKNIIPNSQNILNSILTFDVSKKISILALVLMLAIFSTISVGELWEYEGDTWGDYEVVEILIKNFPPKTFERIIGEVPLRISLLSLSDQLFGSDRVIPFLSSISLVIVTYLFSLKLTKKRISGLVSSAVLLTSGLFLEFSNIATYTTFWVVFYILSLYFLDRRWYLSAPLFIMSLLSKAITVSFLPITLFFIGRSSISRLQKRNFIIYTSLIIIFVIIGFVFSFEKLVTSDLIFHFPRFMSGFTVFNYQLRSDLLFMLFLPALIYGLYKKSSLGHIHADSIIVGMAGIILASSILTGFLNFQINQYRFIPLIVFFAIGVGLLLAKNNSIGKNEVPKGVRDVPGRDLDTMQS